MAAERGDEGSPYSLTADAESVVLNFANVLTYSRVLLYTLKIRITDTLQRKDQNDCIARMTHTVSGASLSLFSSRYLTSEIRRQPALLNSAEMARNGNESWHQTWLIGATCLARA